MFYQLLMCTLAISMVDCNLSPTPSEMRNGNEMEMEMRWMKRKIRKFKKEIGKKFLIPIVSSVSAPLEHCSSIIFQI